MGKCCTMDVNMAYNKLEIKYLPIEQLIPYAGNARTHTDDQINQIVKSIQRHGWTNPILLDGNKGIIAGHGRLFAARKLNLTEVPTLDLSFASDAQKAEYIIADNKLALNAGWDYDILNVQFDILEDAGIELGDTGFSAEELNTIRQPQILTEGLCDEDDAPALPIMPITKLGDVWILGEHRLICGDSTIIDNVEKLMNGEKADMVFTDPPYGISVVKSDGNIGGSRKDKWGAKANCSVYQPIIGDDQPFDPSLLLTLAPLQIIFGANNFASKLPNNSHWIVWVKDMPEGTDFSGAELAWTNIDKKAVKTYKFTWAGMTREGNRKDELSKRVHPTQKPVGLFSNILNDYDPKSVIDLYGGSGSTLIACEKTNRKCFMMELSEHYCDVIINRWQKFTGKEAILESSQQKYDEVTNG